MRQILTFSRRQEVSHELISLGPVVQEAVRLLRATIPATVEFTVTLSPDLPPVLADPTEIHQIVMNLGTNAWHAMREKPGRLHLTLEAFQVDPELADTHRQLRVGSYVRLSISDTGHGMDRSTLERIFEPFFTTKDPGEGTGLGLSVVHGIMEAQDGAITVYSEPGQGTTFHLYFPAREASGLTLVQPAHTEVRGRGERILLVDDEAPLARLGEKVLGGLGYVVEPYSSAEGALAAFRADPTRYAAVVTDQTMPGLTGIELAREIIGVRPLTPVILITGYTAALDRRHLQKFGITEVLSKPHTRQSLGAAVHRALRELETRGGT
ncbi:MAG TPA: ATP-binding protein [Candidatus Synoicihabitans sp.]|nr:ATP-binding protein [Candidatus Synoicihabitans sp.]